MKKINKIAFIGIGLINSSLARDLKNTGFYNVSSAFSRTKKTRNILRKLNIVDLVEENIEETVQGADIIVIGVPVAAFTNVIQKICKHLKDDAQDKIKKVVINYGKC